ncbi:MAG TPA: YncE family protein [Bacteroidota bacterium]|nr:YncE family protein [Bacteroidota bacterium]
MNTRVMMLIGILGAFPFGCVQNPTSAIQEIPIPSAQGVYIINQGNFGRANATLSYFDLQSFRVYNDVFGSVNGKVLGDVAQSMSVRGGTGYIVVNNSQKIEVIDLASNVNTSTIPTGSGSSPEEMVFASDTVALVTDLYANQALVVNLRTRALIGAIGVGENPVGIVIAAGKAYVANSGFGNGKTVSVISLSSMSVIRTITVSDNPNGIELTPSGMVYAVCTGSYDFSNPANDTPAKIMVIDPSSDAVVDSIYIGGHASDIAIGADGTGYIPTTTEVLQIDTRVHTVTGTFKTGVFYAVGVELSSGDVYLADAKDFVQPGTVSVFEPNGELRTQFNVGIIPGAFAFKR